MNGNKEKTAESEKNLVYVVGIGPGSEGMMTQQVRRILENCDVIIGYTVYVELLRKIFPQKEYQTTPMRREEERCRMAFREAQKGRVTAMV